MYVYMVSVDRAGARGPAAAVLWVMSSIGLARALRSSAYKVTVENLEFYQLIINTLLTLLSNNV